MRKQVLGPIGGLTRNPQLLKTRRDFGVEPLPMFQDRFLPDETGLPGVGFQFGPVDIQDVRLDSFLFDQGFIYLQEDVFQSALEPLGDQALEAHVRGRDPLGQSHETDIRLTRLRNRS